MRQDVKSQEQVAFSFKLADTVKQKSELAPQRDMIIIEEPEWPLDQKPKIAQINVGLFSSRQSKSRIDPSKIQEENMQKRSASNGSGSDKRISNKPDLQTLDPELSTQPLDVNPKRASVATKGPDSSSQSKANRKYSHHYSSSVSNRSSLKSS